LLLKGAQDANLITTGILSGAKYQGMHIELVGAAAVAVVAALAIVAKLTAATLLVGARFATGRSEFFD
jgi:hypothetical protein